MAAPQSTFTLADIIATEIRAIAAQNAGDVFFVVATKYYSHTGNLYALHECTYYDLSKALKTFEWSEVNINGVEGYMMLHFTYTVPRVSNTVHHVHVLCIPDTDSRSFEYPASYTTVARKSGFLGQSAHILGRGHPTTLQLP